ncbi:hypothetical protein SBA3_2780009 [Candidatus Sulfopaludibacter sp. SbA3]|nr:hypothetical protein SBA3_2780009 [Candidatus Sulfopaludibacter sp. SbA3]
MSIRGLNPQFTRAFRYAAGVDRPKTILPNQFCPTGMLRPLRADNMVIRCSNWRPTTLSLRHT